HGTGSGEVPASPPVDAAGCLGRHGMESFLAPQLITHAAHVKVDRATGVVRVLRIAAAHDSGTIINRLGADGQVYGGVVMDIAWIETETPDAGPKGSKGVGEPPCVATPAAIANAIAAAIGSELDQLPMIPERVWAASRGAG
ncbi:MAG: molybdopterin cofactor-binding domain-containing protein, partial [Gaiellales bacterium]